METRVLGQGLEVSNVGFGCMGFSHAYGPATEKAEAIESIRFAAECGYTLFDTAESYTGTCASGEPSNNEELVGEALAPFGDGVVIATKFGVRHEGRTVVVDSSPATIRSSVEGSLKRLGVERIDLYYQHRIDPRVEPEVVAGVMADLIAEGKIAHWGISEATEDYLRRAHAVCPVTAVQNRYSMMARDHEALFPVLEELGIGFVAFSPMANGLLTAAYSSASSFGEDDYRSAMPQFEKGADEENAELIEMISRCAREKGATPGQISMAWMISKKPYIVPIPGSRNRGRIAENAGAGGVRLSADEVAAIDAALDGMETSAVFGGNRIKSKE